MRSHFRTLCLLAIPCVLAACDGNAAGTRVLSLTPGSGSVELGRTIRVAFEHSPEQEADWSSSDPTVARVTDDGLVTTFAPGSVTITARSSSGRGTATVTVTPPPANEPVAKAVATGSFSSCAVVEVTGAPGTYCWGSATGSFGGSTAPAQIAGGGQLVTLSTRLHRCGLDAGGSAFCWGGNELGALGTGSQFGAMTPAAVAGRLRFTSLAVGTNHTCAVTQAGAAYCWGSAPALGSRSPMEVCYTDRRGNVFECARTPVPVASDESFTSVSAGDQYTCALDRNGAAHCWGGTSGSLPARVPGSVRFTSLASGLRSDLACGVDQGGTARCWSPGRVPAPVEGGVKFASLTMGAGHVCGVSMAGIAHCWGDNARGQVGNGQFSMSSRVEAPAAVATNLTFASIHAGAFSTCARTTAGAVYCWGDNESGELGTSAGTQICSYQKPCATRPVRVPFAGAISAPTTAPARS